MYGEGVSEASVKGKGLVGVVNANARFGVLSDAFLEEVCFALKADRFHPFKRVPSFEVTVTAKAEKKLVGAKFDAVAHHSGVHSDQFDREGISDEFHLDCTALLMISTIRDPGSRLISFKHSRHTKSQWSPSSRLISSLLKHRPGIKPHFLSQKIAHKEPEKKMHSMAANAIMPSAKLAEVASHHLRAHCALR